MLFAKDLREDPQLLLKIVLKRIYTDYDISLILRQHITKIVHEAKQISIGEIDQQLYAKYGFDESEIAFIESKIKTMA